VQVQNKLQQALPRLPQQVQQQGLVVTKANPDFLMVVAIYDETEQEREHGRRDYLVSNVSRTIGSPRSRASATSSVRHAICDAHLARPVQAAQPFSLMPSRHRDGAARAEYAGFGRTDRPAADAARQMLSRRDLALAAHTVDQFAKRHQDLPDGSRVLLSGCRAGRARQRELSVPRRINGHPGVGHRRSSWRRAAMR
jgi:multidrug efflux pump